jgi:hypothetical protein
MHERQARLGDDGDLTPTDDSLGFKTNSIVAAGSMNASTVL